MSSIGAYYNPEATAPVTPLTPMNREVVRTAVGNADAGKNYGMYILLGLLAVYLVAKEAKVIR